MAIFLRIGPVCLGLLIGACGSSDDDANAAGSTRGDGGGDQDDGHDSTAIPDDRDGGPDDREGGPAGGSGGEGAGCAPGFAAERGGDCEDIDECQDRNGGCEQHCENTEGSFECSCDDGYELGANSASCEVLSCDPGYTLGEDGVRCADVDECAIDNGGCEGACENTPGDRACSCGADQELASDQRGCRGWSMSDVIQNGLARSAALDLAVNAAGDAFAVWLQNDGTNYNVWANLYTPGAGWGVAEAIHLAVDGDDAEPHVAVDPDGNAFAVWVSAEGAGTAVRGSRYVPGTGWQTGVPDWVDAINVGNESSSPAVAVDAHGHAIAVWLQSVGARAALWANRYATPSGWGQPVQIDNGGPGAIEYPPQVALDAAGNAVVLWTQPNGTTNDLWSNRYLAGGNWGDAELLETEDGQALLPRIVLQPDTGDGVAVWMQTDEDGAYEVWTNRFEALAGFQGGERVASDATGRSPDAAIDTTGNIVVAWSAYRDLGDGTFHGVWWNRFTPDGGWTDPQLLSSMSADVGGNGSVNVAMNAAGAAAIAYLMQPDPLSSWHTDIWAASAPAGASFGAPVLLETQLGPAIVEVVGIDDANDVEVVWLQSSDGDRPNVWSSRFE